jgi:RNA polymerase sigma-70 factor (ECF subfamily)
MARAEEGPLELAVREHARLVYRIAYSVLRSPADAEDAVQETFLRVLRYERKMTGIQDQKAWLAQAAWRTAIEHRRRVAGRSARSEEVPSDLASGGLAADSMLVEKERGEILQQLIRALPDALRDSLVLSTLEELSPREVGTILGISEAAVRARTFRARAILRERIIARMGDRK